LQISTAIQLPKKRTPEMNNLSDYAPTQKIQKISSYKEDKFSIGMFLLERYEIIGKKEGGMGIIYIVRDNKRKWDYAVKTLNTSKLDLGNKGTKQFLTEIEHLVELPPHHQVVQIDHIEFINDKPYIFMEYIEGMDLREKLEKSKQKRLAPDIAINYALQICEGMRLIHNEGRILHLDLKPENILVNREDTIKISDFGISQPSLSLARMKISRPDGTYLYMSPEQIKGESVDVWSDIYSFGIVLYEMLSGKPPYPPEINVIRDQIKLKQKLLEFHNSDYDFHQEFSHKDIIPGLPDKMGTLLGHCLAKIQSQRIPDFGYLQRWMERDFGYYKKELPQQFTKINFYRKGLSLQAIGKHSKALEYFNRELMMNPLNTDLWEDAANSLSVLGMKEQEKMFRSKARQFAGRVPNEV